jgi:dolichyl-phosphate beta-glucosyltransferase
VPDPQTTILSLSVILPAYNEAARLPPYLGRLLRYLNTRRASYEILIVDDGSTDDTAGAIKPLIAGNPAVRLIRLATNRGKGAAVRAGMLESRGARCLMADADGAASIDELPRLEAAIERGADIAIGSRLLASRDPRYRVRARRHRTVLGNLFNAVVQRLGIPGITDTQCGFKLFRRSVAHDLFSVSRIDGYGLDLELLYVAQRRPYRIEEVPINWADQPGSKVRVLADGFRMLRDLFAVRVAYANGRYTVRTPASPLAHQQASVNASQRS